jgi:hypothetical protein
MTYNSPPCMYVQYYRLLVLAIGFNFILGHCSTVAVGAAGAVYGNIHISPLLAYFALKGTQTKAKGDAPGLKSSDVSLDSGSEGPN